MTTAHTRCSKWIKRAVIGGTAAVMIGGGIGVAANAAPGEITTTVLGKTPEEAEANGKKACENGGMDFGGVVVPARRLPDGALEPGNQNVFQVTVKCILRENPAANPPPAP